MIRDTKHYRSGFSLIEVVITACIVSFLFAAFSYSKGIFLKRDLIQTQEEIVINMQRARYAGMNNGKYSGVWFQSNTMTTFIDNNSNGAYDAGTDSKLMLQYFHGDVVLANGCGNNSIETGTREYIIFDKDGFAGSFSGGVFVPFDWQVFVYNPSLSVGDQAREVETLANGLIQKVLAGNTGLVTTNARQANKNNASCSP